MKIIFSLFAICFIANAFGQSNEFRLSFNSGLFCFAGKSSEAFSFYLEEPLAHTSYTNNPYGTEKGPCYGISAKWKRISGNIVFGLDLGYEWLISHIAIDKLTINFGTSTVDYWAYGRTSIKTNFINFHPFVGYRFPLKSWRFDLTGGMDIGHVLHAKERLIGQSSFGRMGSSQNRKTITTDVRTGLQLSIDHNRYGVYVGYMFGLSNYKSGYIGGANECYSRLLRFGWTYLLQKRKRIKEIPSHSFLSKPIPRI